MIVLVSCDNFLKNGWADGLLTEEEFLKGVKYQVEKEIIVTGSIFHNPKGDYAVFDMIQACTVWNFDNPFLFLDTLLSK